MKYIIISIIQTLITVFLILWCLLRVDYEVHEIYRWCFEPDYTGDEKEADEEWHDYWGPDHDTEIFRI